MADARAEVAAQPGSSVTVGTTSTPIVPSRPSRLALTVCNDHGSAVVYLRLAASGAATGQGIRLGPGQSWSTELYSGPVSAVSNTASTNVAFVEV